MRKSYVLALIASSILISAYSLLVFFSRSINLGNLSKLLEEQAWEEADKKTDSLILRLTRRDKIYLYYLNPDWFQISSTPCSDLMAIDRLWKSYSNNQKSFTVFINQWERSTEEIDWSDYSYLADDSNSLRATQAFRERYMKEGKIETSVQQEISYPANHWIIDGAADFEDPILLLNDFIDRYKLCSREEQI